MPRAQAVWKLYTTGAAGSQGLMGQAMLHRLAQLPGVAVRPFDRADARRAGSKFNGRCWPPKSPPTPPRSRMKHRCGCWRRLFSS